MDNLKVWSNGNELMGQLERKRDLLTAKIAQEEVRVKEKPSLSGSSSAGGVSLLSRYQKELLNVEEKIFHADMERMDQVAVAPLTGGGGAEGFVDETSSCLSMRSAPAAPSSNTGGNVPLTAKALAEVALSLQQQQQQQQPMIAPPPAFSPGGGGGHSPPQQQQHVMLTKHQPQAQTPPPAQLQSPFEGYGRSSPDNNNHQQQQMMQPPPQQQQQQQGGSSAHRHQDVRSGVLNTVGPTTEGNCNQQPPPAQVVMPKDHVGYQGRKRGWEGPATAVMPADHINFHPNKAGPLPMLLKTKLCFAFRAGGCSKGDHCNYAHGDAELRPPPAAIMPQTAGGGDGWGTQPPPGVAPQPVHGRGQAPPPGFQQQQPPMEMVTTMPQQQPPLFPEFDVTGVPPSVDVPDMTLMAPPAPSAAANCLPPPPAEIAVQPPPLPPPTSSVAMAGLLPVVAPPPQLVAAAPPPPPVYAPSPLPTVADLLRQGVGGVSARAALELPHLPTSFPQTGSVAPVDPVPGGGDAAGVPGGLTTLTAVARDDDDRRRRGPSRSPRRRSWSPATRRGKRSRSHEDRRRRDSSRSPQSRQEILLHPCLDVRKACSFPQCTFAHYPRDVCLAHLKWSYNQAVRKNDKPPCLNSPSTCAKRHMDWRGENPQLGGDDRGGRGRSPTMRRGKRSRSRDRSGGRHRHDDDYSDSSSDYSDDNSSDWSSSSDDDDDPHRTPAVQDFDRRDDQTRNPSSLSDPLHPCLRAYGKCNFGDECSYATYPRHVCLPHLKWSHSDTMIRTGRKNADPKAPCTKGAKCQYQHMDWIARPAKKKTNQQVLKNKVKKEEKKQKNEERKKKNQEKNEERRKRNASLSKEELAIRKKKLAADLEKRRANKAERKAAAAKKKSDRDAAKAQQQEDTGSGQASTQGPLSATPPPSANPPAGPSAYDYL